MRAEDLPILCCRRGWSDGDVWENSMSAIVRAVQKGFNGLMIDVRPTRDDELVVFRDASLQRIAGNHLQVRDARFETLTHYRLPGAVPERIPRLGEVLNFVRGKACVLIEWKEQSSDTRTARRLVNVLKETQMLDECVVFPESEWLVADLDDRIPVGIEWSRLVRMPPGRRASRQWCVIEYPAVFRSDRVEKARQWRALTCAVFTETYYHHYLELDDPTPRVIDDLNRAVDLGLDFVVVEPAFTQIALDLWHRLRDRS